MDSYRFSEVVNVFHGISLPESKMRLVGYAALIAYFGLNCDAGWSRVEGWQLRKML